MLVTNVLWQIVLHGIGITATTLYVIGVAALVVPTLLGMMVPRMFPRLADAEKRIETEAKNRRELEDDSDYQMAIETAERVKETLSRTDWSDARRFVDELLGEQLPALIRLRRDLTEDRQKIAEHIAGLGKGAKKASRRAALATTGDKIDALCEQASDRVAASVDALGQLLVIARERQLNDSPDAIIRADRLLAETQRANDLLLATRREIESVGSSN
jgi:hypothetical protein